MQVGATLVNRNGPSLVVAEAIVGRSGDVRNQGKGNAGLGRWVAKAQSVVGGLVGIDVGRDVVGMVAIVGSAQPDSFAQIAFQGEVPFLDDGILIFDFGRQIEELRARLSDVGGEGVGERENRDPVAADGIGEKPHIARALRTIH